MHTTEFSVRVLGVREDGEWCAIALDMSVRGYGDTFQEALDELKDAVEAQLSFALQHDRLDRIWVPADPQYVELYQDARRFAMRNYLLHREDSEMIGDEYAASDIPLPRASSESFQVTA